MPDSIDENNYVCHLPVIVSSDENRLQHALDKCVALNLGRKEKLLFVYVVRCHDYVKIGIADDIKSRIANLQTGCPYKLTLLRHWRSSDAISEEERLHERWDAYRERGEWFKIPDDKLASWFASLDARLARRNASQ